MRATVRVQIAQAEYEQEFTFPHAPRIGEGFAFEHIVLRVQDVTYTPRVVQSVECFVTLAAAPPRLAEWAVEQGWLKA